MCPSSHFFNIGFSPCCWRPDALRVIIQNWSWLAKFIDEVWNCVPVRSNVVVNALLTFFCALRWSNVLFDDEYRLLGAVQNRTKTNNKQMASVLQCVSKVSSNCNHSLRRTLSLNLVGTFWTALYKVLPLRKNAYCMDSVCLLPYILPLQPLWSRCHLLLTVLTRTDSSRLQYCTLSLSW
jgi:hypothetical protein